MQTSISLPESEVFTSWKEIASYLNKGVRTVQRWEAEFGLPVRRPISKRRGRVHALRQDLDEWMNSTWAHRAGKLATRDSDERHRTIELRLQNRQLLADVQNSLGKLIEQCKLLNSQTKLPH